MTEYKTVNCTIHNRNISFSLSHQVRKVCSTICTYIMYVKNKLIKQKSINTKVNVVECVSDLVLHVLDHAADVGDVRRHVTHR